MVWNLIQRALRAHLVASKTSLPHHQRKLSDNIPPRFLFELFPSVQTIVLTNPDGRQEKRTLGIEHWQTKAAEVIGVDRDARAPVMSCLAGLSRGP